jgi:uncharacterized cupin superfamily protein
MTDTPRRHPNVVNIAELQPQGFSRGGRFALQNRPLGRATGARGIGCSLYEVPPGRTAFPHHFHCANEESLYILAGTGTLRIGPEQVPVRAGDYATFPVGPAQAHQLINTGTDTLRYLCFSTLLSTEVVGYPDSGKTAAMAYGAGDQPWVRAIFRNDSAVDYYDGELDPPAGTPGTGDN